MDPKPEDKARDEKQRIWDELDQSDVSGKPPAKVDAEKPAQTEPQKDKPADATPAAGTETKPVEAPTDAAPADQALRDELAGMKALIERQGEALRKANGTIGDLKDKVTKLGTAPKPPAQSDPAKKSSMDELKAEYPQFAESMEAVLKEREAALRAEFEAKTPAQHAGISAEEFERYKRQSAVDAKHPGWQDQVKTNEFTGWLQRQPREVQLLAASESPQDAIRLLDLRKEALAKAKPADNPAHPAASLPTGRASSTGAQPKRLEDLKTKAEIWAYLDEQERSAAASKFAGQAALAA